VANPSFPANNVKELIALAKSKPGQIQYASAGNGTPNHLLAEMFKDAAGIDLQHIPYKGAAAAVTDVISGQVPLAFQSMPSSMSYVKSGKLKVLGVATEKRTALAPDIPAISETVPGFYTVSWYGLLAPAGTPKDIVEKLRAATVKALSDKEVKEKLAAQGAEPFITTPEQFAALIKDEMPKWAKIVKDSGAKVD
jgi:tripartite-type tricarboxylate transporter receptor subunit TctC